MILVTGCLGFIGSNLCRELVKNKRVLGLDIFDDKKGIEAKFPFVKSENFTLVNADITDYKELSKIFRQYRITKAIHLAAKSNPRSTGSNAGEYVDVNVMGTLGLLEECRKNHVKQFVFISTSNVY